jgi:hypothetical protein
VSETHTFAEAAMRMSEAPTKTNQDQPRPTETSQDQPRSRAYMGYTLVGATLVDRMSVRNTRFCRSSNENEE